MKRHLCAIVALLCATLSCAGGAARADAAEREMSEGPLSADDGEMLLNYYVGTTPAREAVGMTETYELVLSRMPDDTGRIDEYVRSSRDAPEVRRSWRVPMTAWDEAREIITARGMEGWNDRRSAPRAVGGPIYVCKFKQGERLIRVTSEQMPDGGMAAFNGISALLHSYMEDGEEIEP